MIPHLSELQKKKKPRNLTQYSALFFVYCCDKETMAKSNLENKGFIWLLCPNHSSLLREVKAGTQAWWEPRGKN